MKYITPLLVWVALVLIATMPTSSYAQSQAEMNQEASKNFDQADLALNRAYKQLLSKIDKEAQAKLKIAQRAWIAFRDGQAELEADLEARGGSMAPLIYNGRRTEITKARTKELQKLLEDYGN